MHQRQPVFSAKLQDTETPVQIIGCTPGTLGEPLGTLLTIRGEWVRGGEMSDGPLFGVYLANAVG